MEHRWGARIACDIAVRVDARPQLLALGFMRNASLSGGFIETNARLLPCTPVLIQLESAALRYDWLRHVRAYVVRDDAAGLAVEWYEFAPEPIRAVLALARNRAPASAEVQHARSVLLTSRDQPSAFSPQPEWNIPRTRTLLEEPSIYPRAPT